MSVSNPLEPGASTTAVCLLFSMTPARRHRWSSSFAAPRVCRVGWATLLDLQRRRHGGTVARHPPGGWSGASGAATAPADKNGSSCAVWLVYAKALHDWRARKGKREGPHPQVEMCHTVLVVRNGKEMAKGCGKQGWVLTVDRSSRGVEQRGAWGCGWASSRYRCDVPEPSTPDKPHPHCLTIASCCRYDISLAATTASSTSCACCLNVLPIDCRLRPALWSTPPQGHRVHLPSRTDLQPLPEHNR